LHRVCVEMSETTNWTLPNAITIARIIMVPAFVVVFINANHAAALLLFIAAGVSDALDGFLARVLRQRTKLGAMLDPMADKLLLITAYMCLGLGGLVSSWLAVLVISRDVMLIGGMALLHFWGVNIRDRIRPTWLSKFNTCAQIVLVIAVLAGVSGQFWEGLMQVLVAIVASATALSGAHYIYIGLGLFPRGD
jgi:cardiolipin synthase (CMP-forming)